MKSFETIRNDNSKILKTHIVIEIIAKILKQKIFKFFYKFKNVFNFKKIENFLFHRVYDHKIEFIDDFLKTKYIFYRLKNSKKLKKKFINFNNVFFVSFILFVIISNELLKLYVDY